MAIAGRVAIVPKGEYQSGAQYKRLDLVTKDGRTYVCKAETTTADPTVETDWMFLIESDASSIARVEQQVNDIVSGTTKVGNAETLDGHDSTYFATAQALADVVSGATKVGASTTADTATNADNATNATNANNASNADKLDNHDSTYFATAQSVTNIVNGATKVGDADKLDGLDSSYFGKQSDVASLLNVDAEVYSRNLGMTADRRVPTKSIDANEITENCIINVATNESTNLPPDVGLWGFLQTFMHAYTNTYATQIYYSMTNDYDNWIRIKSNNIWQDWKRINDGGNADLLNGLTATEVGMSGARNLLRFPYLDITKTKGGITYTVNADGSVTANGTATENVIFSFSTGTQTSNKMALKKGTYTFSGTPSGGSTYSYFMQVGRTVNNAYFGYGNEIGNGLTFTLDEDVDAMQFQIQIKSGTTVNNLVFKPMLELGKVVHPFVPYNFGNADTLDGKHASEFAQIVDLGGTQTDTKKCIASEGSNTVVYRCTNWVDYPTECRDAQGTLIAMRYARDGIVGTDAMWLRQYFFSPFDNATWVRIVEGLVVSDWVRIIDSRGGTVSGDISIAKNSGASTTLNVSNNNRAVKIGVDDNGNIVIWDATRNQNVLWAETNGNVNISNQLTVQGHLSHHDGNSRKVIVQSTAPSDTSVYWIDSSNANAPVGKVYLNGAWRTVQ